MDIATVFDVAASDYDATRKKYISCFDDFYGVAIEQIPFQAADSFKILDLGAGTGLCSALIKNIFPHCHITLTDISSNMLEKAKQRFNGIANVHFLEHDYHEQVIPGNYDVVISALSLHHSSQTELGEVFKKIYSALKRGGLFINADQILGRTADIEKEYEKAWLTQAKVKQCTEQEINIALERMKADKTLPLSMQLALLEAADFAQINCWYQYYRYAVYTGVKE